MHFVILATAGIQWRQARSEPSVFTMRNVEIPAFADTTWLERGNARVPLQGTSLLRPFFAFGL